MNAFRTAYVYVRSAFAGVLKETDKGYSFMPDDMKNALCMLIQDRLAILK